MGTLHAAIAPREKSSRKCGGRSRGDDYSGRVLGVGRTDLWVWRRGLHVQGTAGTAGGSEGHYWLDGRGWNIGRMGSIRGSKSLERIDRERERSRRPIWMGRQRNDSCTEWAWNVGVL